MISEKQAASFTERLALRLSGVVSGQLQVWQLLFLAAVIGTIWAATLLDWSFVTGRSVYWQSPQTTAGGGVDLDPGTALVGYLYYVQSPWHLPLFYVSTLGAPAGVNVIFTDLVPIVALIGKLICNITGATTNPYGAYLFLCFSLPGVMMTLVLIVAKIRYALAAILAAIFANTTPALLSKWGDFALEAHFLLIGALALYLFSLQTRARRGLATAWIGYLILVYLTNIYLFAMVGTVWLCAIIQRRLDGLTTSQEALGIGALTIMLATIVIALVGQFGPGTPLPISYGYGHYSMNLASPFVPQSSGLFPWSERVIDATGGQYEGFNYLGLGLLLASLLVLPAEVGWLRRNLKRHVALFVAFVALTAFAISNRVFVGHWLLFELPLPYQQLFGIFRSSGRFFWLICYTQMAIVIILGFRSAQPLIAVCLAGAAIVQLFDVQQLRERIVASIADGASAQELAPGSIARLMAGARHIEVIPSFQCIYWEKKDQLPVKLARANVELMLAAARANVPTNTVYLARYSYGLTWHELLRDPFRGSEIVRARRDDYCKQEIERARGGGSPGDIFVLLSDQPRTDEMVPGVTCSPLSWARYCQRP
jgi:hypothetical protein